MESRYEFRVFGDLADQRDLLCRAAEALGKDQRCDVYFLNDDPSCILKLRDGDTFDLKRLIACDGEYQRWQPSGQVDLPVTGQKLNSSFAAVLPEMDADSLYDTANLIARFDRKGWQVLEVQKDRSRYTILGVEAEYTRLWLGDDRQSETIAIEGRDIQALEKLRVHLRLQGRPNTSYPEWLIRTA